MPPTQVISVDSIEELPDRLPRNYPYFTLLLAWDVP